MEYEEKDGDSEEFINGIVNQPNNTNDFIVTLPEKVGENESDIDERDEEGSEQSADEQREYLPGRPIIEYVANAAPIATVDRTISDEKPDTDHTELL